jgi:capsular polysaccharide transport system permease protein
MLLKTTGFGSSGDEIYAAQNYMLSRDALKALDKRSLHACLYGAIYIGFRPIRSFRHQSQL